MPRDAVRPGRTVLFWGLACFLIFQIGLAIAIAVWLPGFGDPNYAYKAERGRQYFAGSGPDTSRVIVLGSSRVLFGLDAAGLGNDLTAATGRPVAVFNFGVNGAGPVTELLYLRKLLREGIAPDVLLIEVLPPYLAGQATPPPETRWFLPSSRLSAEDRALLARFGFPTEELGRTWRNSWLIPWHVHRQALLSRWGPSWLPFDLRLTGNRHSDAAGWVREEPRSLDRPMFQAANREHFSECFTGFRLDGFPAEALRELLNTCQTAGIPAVLILMPETTLFRSWYPTEMEGAVQQFLNDLGVPRIDAREWVPDDGFFDADHLHPGGAMILRRKLSQTATLRRSVAEPR